MIQEFSIRNYLSIKATQTLSFVPRKSDLDDDTFTAEASPGVRLLKSALLYGANASGKTNILKALDFLRKIVIKTRKREDDTGFVPFNFDSEYRQSPGEFEIIFFHEQKKFKYYLKINETRILEEELNYYPGKRPAKLYERKTINDQEIFIKFNSTYKVNSAEEKMIRARTLPNVSVLSSFSEVSIQNKVLFSAFQGFSKLMPIIYPKTSLKEYTTRMINKDSKIEQLITILMKKADFNINKIVNREESIPFDESIFSKLNFPDTLVEKLKEKGKITRDKTEFYHNIIENDSLKSYSLESELESRGTWRYFGLAGPILEALKHNEVLNIDELDSSLHPDLLCFIYLMFLVNSHKAQMIFTLHNRELLDDKELRRRDNTWFTEKQKDGSTELYSIADIEGIRNDKSFEKLYKSGKFGAIPNLGSIYLDLDHEE